MKTNVYAYYGVLCPKSEVTSHMVQLGKQDMYAFIAEKNLQYRKYGSIADDYRIVVGKELFGGVNDKIKSDVKEKGHVVLNPIDGEQIKLSASEEQKVREKLLTIGVYGEPKYYIFSNWEA